MYNLFLCEIFKDAEKEMLGMNHMYVGTEHLFLSLLKNSTKISKLCSKYNLNYNTFKECLL